ncbi:MAG: hypothetical protein JKY65_13310 [Planctomycetes bacterium]|nr:hypothetical protein [Planctomycetota bacterium]
MSEAPEEEALDLAQALGAEDQTSVQVLTLYIPSKDRLDQDLANQRRWVMEAAEILAQIGGGVTILSPVEGGWVGEVGEIVWETPVVLYTYVRPDELIATLPHLRRFLHRMGRETGQGEIAFEFDGSFYRILSFDEEESDDQTRA